MSPMIVDFARLRDGNAFRRDYFYLDGAWIAQEARRVSLIIPT